MSLALLQGSFGPFAPKVAKRVLNEFPGPLSNGIQRGGSRSGLVLPFLSFFVLFGIFRFFRDFPDLFGDSPGIFPICVVPLSRPINSTNEEQSRKGPRHNPDLSRKKWETPRFGNPPVWKPPGLASLKSRKLILALFLQLWARRAQ